MLTEGRREGGAEWQAFVCLHLGCSSEPGCNPCNPLPQFRPGRLQVLVSRSLPTVLSASASHH